MDDLEGADIWGNDSQEVDDTASMSNDDLKMHIRLLDTDLRIMRSDIDVIKHESQVQKDAIKENVEKSKFAFCGGGGVFSFLDLL